MTIKNILAKCHKKIAFLDLELIIADVIKKPREFVLAHPEFEIPKNLIRRLAEKIARRRRGEPLAYILGYKEFFGLDFKVNKDVLVPRPETEQIIELATRNLKRVNFGEKIAVIDIGTGSGNIIISLACGMQHATHNRINYFASDISPKALAIARYNAKKHRVDKKIKFLKGNLLTPIIGNWKLEIGNSRIVILANLPYLSKEIYNSAPRDVKKYEPKSALTSGIDGLDHYRKLLQQIKKLAAGYGFQVTGYLEIGPEQKPALQKTIKSILPDAEIEFIKDLAGKWRICRIVL